MIDPAVVTGIDAFVTGLRILGLGLVAAAAAGTAAFVYRARFDLQLPDGASIIVGLGVVAVYLNSRLFFVQFVGEDGDPLTASAAAINLFIFIASAVGAMGGHSLGDRIGAADRFDWIGKPASLSPIVRATGRYITVTLPADIADIEGYEPVDPDQKQALTGRQFDFAKGMTLEELETQLRTRLMEQHNIGYVDLELTTDGDVTYLAVGARPAGIGPTIPPGMAAVAVPADPPFSASAGDIVELFTTSARESLGTAEVRGIADDVVTLICDWELAERIDPTGSYRLVTLPETMPADRAFAAMIRREVRGVSLVSITTGGVLDGAPVGSLALSVVAIERDGAVTVTPSRRYTLAGGDRLYVLGRPERLRKLDEQRGVTVGWPPDEVSEFAD